MTPVNTASLFLINSLFDLYLLILFFRLLFQYLRIDYYNPLSQFIVKVTNPLVVPLRRIIPGFWGIDFATVLLILAFTTLKLILTVLIMIHHFPSLLGLLIWSIADIVTFIIKIFFYAILMKIILSWVAPTSHSPITIILHRLSDPFLRPARRLIPHIAGFDISPIPVLIFLQCLLILIAQPITQIGMGLAIR